MKKRFIALACILFVTFVAASVFGCINPKPKQLSALVSCKNIEKIIFTCTPLHPDDAPYDPSNDPYTFELNEEQKNVFFENISKTTYIESDGWLHTYSWHYEIYYLDGSILWFYAIQMYYVQNGEIVAHSLKYMQLMDLDWEIFLLENPALSAQ